MIMESKQVLLVKYTKDDIISLLETNDRAVMRAVYAIYKRQTDMEKYNEQTFVANGIGFTGAHGHIGTSMGKQFEARGFLTKKQIGWWRKRIGKHGRMRIAMYAKQLLDIAAERGNA